MAKKRRHGLGLGNGQLAEELHRLQAEAAAGFESDDDESAAATAQQLGVGFLFVVPCCFCCGSISPVRLAARPPAAAEGAAQSDVYGKLSSPIRRET